MYTNFPALISSLQYQVLDEFTWEIGLNEGSGGNELPMGVDVTIGLKLLGKKLHSTGNTPIYDYLKSTPQSQIGVVDTDQALLDEVRRTDPNRFL
jgi:hypothetical protein